MDKSVLQRTLAEAIRDKPAVTAEGRSLNRLIDGMTIREIPTHVDERGCVSELIDLRWRSHMDPIVFAYTFTLRPGFVKGWGLHKGHEDRYVLLKGEMELVLFDPRPDSSTYNQISRLVLSEHQRRLVNIPKLVWHADHNIGSCDAMIVNFPTVPYDHSNPDKYRLPIDTPLIPYKFNAAGGW
jgi:dTDP-4-dehydrorhamnose 3,5-epimerase